MNSTIVPQTTTTRKQRALQIAAKGEIFLLSPKVYLVTSQYNATTTYRVHLQRNTCTCPDHQARHNQCKHLLAAELIEAAMARVHSLATRHCTDLSQLEQRLQAHLDRTNPDPARRQTLQILLHATGLLITNANRTAAHMAALPAEIALTIRYRTTGGRTLPRIIGPPEILTVSLDGITRAPHTQDHNVVYNWLQKTGYVPTLKAWLDPAGYTRRRRETFARQAQGA